MSEGSKLAVRLQRALLRLLGKQISKTPLSPTDFPNHDIRRILIIGLHDQLRDLLLATPVFRAVRQHFPKAHIAALVRNNLAPILDHNVNLAEVICFFESISGWSVKKAIQFVKRVRSKFDLTIVLDLVSDSVTSDLLAYLSGAKYVLGSEHLVFQPGQDNFIYNLLAPYYDSNKHQTEKNLDIVRFIQVDTEDKSEEIYLTQEERKLAWEFLYENGLQPDDLLLAIRLGARKVRNRWNVTKFVELAKYFSSRHNAQIIVSWGPNDVKLGQYFLNSLPFKPVEAVGLNLRKLAAVFSFCNLVFCCDTDAMHLAASVGTPLVAVFGSTDPEEWKPIGQRFVGLKGVQGNCSFVNVAQVIEAAERLLKAYPKSVEVGSEDFEISEQVVERYLNILNPFDKLKKYLTIKK